MKYKFSLFVLFALVILASAGYHFTARSVVAGESAKKDRNQLDEVTRQCALRLILDQFEMTNSLIDVETLRAKPEAVEEIAGYLDGIVKLHPELKVFVGYGGVPFSSRLAGVFIKSVEGEPDIPSEIQSLIDRLHLKVKSVTPGTASEFDGSDKQIQGLWLDIDIDQPLASWGLVKAMWKASPRAHWGGSSEGFDVSFKDLHPDSGYQTVRIELRCGEYNRRLCFTGHYEDGSSMSWEFIGNSHGVEEMK